MNSVKTLLFTGMLCCLITHIHAQFSNIVVFTQAKEPFTVIINGVQQSPDPETNLKITGLNAPNYKLKILFENKSIPEIDKTVYLQPEVEVTYEVLKNNKGIWVLRMLNSIPLDEVTEQRHDGQDIYIFTTTPRVHTTTVSQSTTVSSGSLAGGTSITTTTTQTTSGVNSHGEYEEERENDHEGSTHGHPDYDGPRGCPRPMSANSFEQALQSISSKSFESSQLTIAKQIVSSNCLLCSQIKQIMKLFTFESSRLEFAKYAYKYTWDLNNYFLLNDAFQFESSIEELNTYINSGR